MSIYEGTATEQEYAHGRDEGYASGELDSTAGLGLVTDAMSATRETAGLASTRNERAYLLGWLRGYRDAVRTFERGRWGT